MLRFSGTSCPLSPWFVYLNSVSEPRSHLGRLRFKIVDWEHRPVSTDCMSIICPGFNLIYCYASKYPWRKPFESIHQKSARYALGMLADHEFMYWNGSFPVRKWNAAGLDYEAQTHLCFAHAYPRYAKMPSLERTCHNFGSSWSRLRLLRVTQESLRADWSSSLPYLRKFCVLFSFASENCD
jgi:hypothetical protein